jgi:hypothetical protein
VSGVPKLLALQHVALQLARMVRRTHEGVLGHPRQENSYHCQAGGQYSGTVRPTSLQYAVSLKGNSILLSCAGYRKGAPAPVLSATELSRLINSLGIRCPPYTPFNRLLSLTLHTVF